MTREVSRENSQAAEDKDPRAVRPDQPKFGRRFICHNRGRYYAREIVSGDTVRYVDARLAEIYSPDDILARRLSSEDLISPDAEPEEVAE